MTFASKPKTARQMAAKARRDAKQAAMGRIAGIALKVEPVTYTENPKTGDLIRDKPAMGFESVQAFFMGRRGYDRSELLEELGRGWEAYLVRVGYAIEYRPGMFALTTKAQKTYGLPTRLPCGIPAKYALAPEVAREHARRAAECRADFMDSSGE